MVLDFYQNTLIQQGWELERIDRESNTLIYHSLPSRIRLLQGLTISAGLTERPGFFHVVLTMGDYTGMQACHAL
jgi:hypothetical protein